MHISEYKPENYGVLGAANLLESVLIFDFENGKLERFIDGRFENIDVVNNNGIFQTNINDEMHTLSDESCTERIIMIAVPILEGYAGSKLLGGITFDMEPGTKTLFQRLTENDSEKEKKIEMNKKVLESAINTADCLKTTYFKRKRGLRDD